MNTIVDTTSSEHRPNACCNSVGKGRCVSILTKVVEITAGEGGQIHTLELIGYEKPSYQVLECSYTPLFDYSHTASSLNPHGYYDIAKFPRNLECAKFQVLAFPE